MTRYSTYASTKRKRIRIIAACVVIVVLLAVVGIGLKVTNENMKAQGAESLCVAIESGARQCAAIEGSYPASLSYLEENYGIVVNHEDFIVTYEIFAENIPPSVTVVPR